MIDQLSAFGVLLVFLSLLFLHVEKQTKLFLGEEIPDKQDRNIAYKKWFEKKSILLIKVVASCIFATLIWWVSIPDVIRVIKTHKFDILAFNAITTSFLLVSFCLLVILVIMIYWLIKLIFRFKH